MARIRTIKPKFWDDVKIGRITRDARLLYIGMWNFADDLGVVVADPVWLKSKIFPYDQIQLQQFEAWLEVLEKTGFISLLTVKSERFYYLPTFSRHQVINKPNVEDVNISKEQLNSLLRKLSERSDDDHGSITDQSRNDQGTIRAGEERKGEDNTSSSSSACAQEDEPISEKESTPAAAVTIPTENKEKSCAKKESRGRVYVPVNDGGTVSAACNPPPDDALRYIPIREVSDYLKGDQAWFESFCMNQHLDPDYVLSKIDEFALQIESCGETSKDKRDCKRHFYNWIRKNRVSHGTQKTTAAGIVSAGQTTNEELDRRCAERVARRLAGG